MKSLENFLNHDSNLIIGELFFEKSMKNFRDLILNFEKRNHSKENFIEIKIFI